MDASPGLPSPAATPDLDLAFAADLELKPELLQAAGAWLDPMEGADLWHTLLSGWLRQLAGELPQQLRARGYSLGLSLVGDTEMAALNSEWRGQCGPTDVLAFAARDEGLDQGPPIPMPPWADGEVNDAGTNGNAEPLELGDIVISVETASRQAHGHGLERELQFLASHGLLHLLGWDHPDDDSLTAMLARQERLLSTPGHPG